MVTINVMGKFVVHVWDKIQILMPSCSWQLHEQSSMCLYGGKVARMWHLTTHPHLAPRLKKEQSYTSTDSHLLTLWGRVLLQKLTGCQLVKKFPEFVEPECSLPHSQMPATYPSPEPDQCSPCFHTTSWRSILTLSSHPSKWSLALRFPHHNPVYTSHLPHTCYMPHLFHSSQFDHQNNIWWGEQITKLLM